MRVLLVHPGGPFWANKDDGAWSIPKGEIGPGEAPLDAAIREFHEETGFVARGDYDALDAVRQAGGKVVQAWVFEGDFDVEDLRSETVTVEWPPRSGRRREFPEVDRAAWFTLEEARNKLNSAQGLLIDQLIERLETRA